MDQMPHEGGKGQPRAACATVSLGGSRRNGGWVGEETDQV